MTASSIAFQLNAATATASTALGSTLWSIVRSDGNQGAPAPHVGVRPGC